MSRNMLFLKNPRVCTDAPLPGMLGGTNYPTASRRARGEPGQSRSPRERRTKSWERPGAPLCWSPRGPRCEQTGRVPRRVHTRGHAHKLRWRVQPGPPPVGAAASPCAPPARARQGARCALGPTEGGALTQHLLGARGLFSFSLSLCKEIHLQPERFARSRPRLHFSVLSFFSVCFPSSVGFGEAAVQVWRRRLRAPGSARRVPRAPPQAEAGVTVNGVWLGPGPRVQSGHSRG